jgi:FKBP-type peptidyl-prolyl cis-trans isomerase 2
MTEKRAKEGDKVRIFYVGKFENKTIFDSTEADKPLEFRIGEGTVIKGFEQAVIGMKVGETKKDVVIPPEQAYGNYDPELEVTIDRTEFPKHITPQLGMMLQGPSYDNTIINVTITKIDFEKITMDGNHRLAGKTLHFDIELDEIF